MQAQQFIVFCTLDLNSYFYYTIIFIRFQPLDAPIYFSSVPGICWMASLKKYKKRSARRDSNPRPQPWQGCALPTEPLAHFVVAVSLSDNHYYT